MLGAMGHSQRQLHRLRRRPSTRWRAATLRWVEWRRHWSHVVQCRTNTELEAEQLPTLCCVRRRGQRRVRLVDPVRYRGGMSHEPADARDRPGSD